MAALSASSPAKCRPNSSPTVSIAERTGISSSLIRRGGITEVDFEKIRDYSIELQSLPFYVDETGGLSISQLTAAGRGG